MPYTAVTLATLKTQLADRYDNSVFWTASQATAAINESLRQWNLFTGMWKKTQLTATTANTVWYTFSSSFVYNMRVTYNGQQMDIASLDSMDNGRPNWEGETTSSGGAVPTRPSKWIPSGLRRLAIWPADASGGGSLALDGVCITPTLSLDADFIDLAQSEHDAILGEALMLLAFKEGGTRFEAAKKWHQEFLIAAAEQNERLKASAYFKKAMGFDFYRPAKPVLSRAESF